MKKRICALALTLALAAGGLSLASDLKWRTDIFFRWEMRLPSGKQINHMWEKNCKRVEPGKVEKEILPAVKRMGLFGKGDALHEKMMAEQLGQLLKPPDSLSCRWRRRRLFIRQSLCL